METRILRYFILLARIGNITNTANELHISQPTLSRQLMDLEAEVGTQLFTRGQKNIVLTPAGIKFERSAQRILEQLSAAKVEARQETSDISGELRIGCVETDVSPLVNDWVAEFQTEHPHVYFSIFGADGNSIKSELDSGNLDMGIVLQPIEAAKYDAQTIPIAETWGLIMSSTSPLAQKKAIVSADLIGLKLLGPRRSIVQDQIASWLKLKPEDLNFVGERNLENNVVSLLKNHQYYDVGINGVLCFYDSELLSFVPFEPMQKSQHMLIWRKNVQLSAVAREFIDFAQSKINRLHS